MHEIPSETESVARARGNGRGDFAPMSNATPTIAYEGRKEPLRDFVTSRREAVLLGQAV